METSKRSIIQFIGYNPVIKPLGARSGGGFIFSIEVNEDEYQNIKDINDPLNKNTPFNITLSK